MHCNQISFDGDDKVILCSIIYMDKSAYIWLGVDSTPPDMNTLITAIETNYGVLNTQLLSVGNDKGGSLANRLSRRFHIQAFISDTLPELEGEEQILIEKELVKELKTVFGPDDVIR